MIKSLLLEKNLMLYGYVVLTEEPRYEHYDVYKAVKIGSTAAGILLRTILKVRTGNNIISSSLYTAHAFNTKYKNRKAVQKF